jgi:hypothetical protein
MWNATFDRNNQREGRDRSMSNLKCARNMIAGICMALCLASWVLAQGATTSLRGTVADASGAVIPGVSLMLSNPSTGYSRSTTSNEQGVYEFLEVPPATYEFSVVAPGFGSYKRTNLTLTVATPATLSVSLQVATTAETVDVNAEAPLINVVNAGLGHDFVTQQIQNLPFEGRNPAAILSLQAGVVSVGNNATQNTTTDPRSGSVAGARNNQTNIMVDGFDNNDPDASLPFQGSLRTTLDSLQEFRVITAAGGAAEAGHSSGAQVTLVTKSGTNQFHGSLYEYQRPTNVVANDYFNELAQARSGRPNTPPFLLRNTFGGSVGGPVVKDRLFFFYTYEGLRQREFSQVTQNVPSADLRNGIVTYTCTGATCPPSGTFTLTPADIARMDPNCSRPAPGLPQGTCPLGPGVNPAILPILKTYPLPNLATVGDRYNVLGYQFSAPAPTNQNTNIARIDYNLKSNQQIFLRGNLQRDSRAGAPQFPGQPPNTLTAGKPGALSIGYTTVLGTNVVNNARYAYRRTGLSTLGTQTQPVVTLNRVSQPFGQTSTSINRVTVDEFGDNLSWTKGVHSLQFGGTLLAINSSSSTNALSFSGASMTPANMYLSAISGIGGSLDPAAFGFPAVARGYRSNYDNAIQLVTGLFSGTNSSYNLTKSGDRLAPLAQGSPVLRNFHSIETELYAQDAWRVRPSLTVTFGARYTLLQPPYETHGNQVAPNINLSEFFRNRAAAMNRGEAYAPLIGFDFSGQANGRAPFWHWDYKNIAPRISFAWSPSFSKGVLGWLVGGSGKTSIRGGWGNYYDHFGRSIVNQYNNAGAFGLSSSTTIPAPGVPTVDGTARFSGLYNIPTQGNTGCLSPPCSFIAVPPSGVLPYFPPADVGAGGFAISSSLDQEIRTPYSPVASLSIQRQLPQGFTLEVAYVGRFGRQLLQQTDIAMPTNLKDPKSGMDYFTAAQALTFALENGVPIQNIAPIPFWENFFPSAAGPRSTQIDAWGVYAPGSIPNNVTATQAMYNMWAGNPAYSEVYAPFYFDLPLYGTPSGCFPACATINGKQTNGYAMWHPQFAALFAWRNVGESNYHGLQTSLRGRRKGFVFDLNYSLSKSLDMGSNPENIGRSAGAATQIVNAWNPRQMYGISDFDLRHQINANWVYDLPFGTGKTFGGQMNGVLNAVLGGWQVSGLYRQSSGFPISVMPGQLWSTNWSGTAPAILIGPKPKTGSFIVGGLPNLFQEGPAAAKYFRPPSAGESGPRNVLRGPGLFNIDGGLTKSWNVTESKKVTFGWQVYNITNTPRFDVLTLRSGGFSSNASLTSSSTLGNFTSTLSKPRVMEFSLRVAF